VVATVHRGDKSQERNPKQRLRNRLVFGLADRVIALSEDQRNHLRAAYNLSGEKCLLLRSGPDLARFIRLPPPSGHGSVVLCTGHLRPERDHETLLRAFRLVLRNFRDAKLWLAGTAELPRVEQLKRMADDLGISQETRFLGFRTDIPNLLASASVVVHTAKWDALPRSVIEAAAAGRPVVAADVGGIPDIVRHGETGLLCEPGHHRAFADAIVRLLGDSDLASRMGREGRKWAKRHFSSEAMTRAYIHLYRELLERGPRGDGRGGLAQEAQ
jgi:glycosyltransferase involved in cell wall biosynthesis